MKTNYRNLVMPYNFDATKIKPTHVEELDYNNINFVKLYRDMPPYNSYDVFDVDPPDPNLQFQRFNIVKADQKLMIYNDETVIIYDHRTYESTVYRELSNDVWKKVFKNIGYHNLTVDHYKYCDFILSAFCKHIPEGTLKEDECIGLVTAHGDKIYGLAQDFEKKEIPFNRAVLLYVLSYTRLAPSEEPHYQWAVDNYKKYLPVIEKCEEEVFFTKII